MKTQYNIQFFVFDGCFDFTIHLLYKSFCNSKSETCFKSIKIIIAYIYLYFHLKRTKASFCRKSAKTRLFIVSLFIYKLCCIFNNIFFSKFIFNNFTGNFIAGIVRLKRSYKILFDRS